MLYGIFNNKTSGRIVGNLGSACGASLRSGEDPRDGEGGQNMAVASRCQKAPRFEIL